MAPNIVPAGFGTEILYSFLIIVCSLMIYFGTKQLYELSSYKGIKYFRAAFLFFASAYFFRSFIKFALVYFNITRIRDFSPRGGMGALGIISPFLSKLTLFLFIYLSSMAIFYLLYSFMWKKWNGDSRKIPFFHVAAILMSLICVMINTVLVYLILNLLFLAFIFVAIFLASRKSKKKVKKHSMYTIYVLLLIFWIFNMAEILIPEFLQTWQLIIYLASSGIFLTILYKVIKRAGAAD